MRKNFLKEKLSKGETVTGAIIQECATQITEIIGLLGFDLLFIDCEHSAINIESATQLIMAAETREITPLVRVPQNLPEIILRYLDTGAMGIIVPDMVSAEEAARAVMAVKYIPQGQRGLAPVRSADYGLRGSLKQYVQIANSETLIFGVVESRQGVENIDAILGTDGIDGIVIGSNDLSNSLGVPGETRHPLVLEAIDKVLAAGKLTGKPIGGVVRGDETPKQYRDKGYRVLLTSVIGFVIKAGKQFVQDARS